MQQFRACRVAAIASRWFFRNASHRFAGSGSLGARRIQREIVLSETSNPSIRSSPWIRGAPQVAFSATIRNIRLRTSFEIRFRPITHRALEIARQYNLNPVQCQPTTVSGLTTMRACFQPDQNLSAKTQKILSNARSLGLGCFRFRMASCCRRTRFSSRRVRRACKHRKMVVTNSKSMRNIAERAR